MEQQGILLLPTGSTLDLCHLIKLLRARINQKKKWKNANFPLKLNFSWRFFSKREIYIRNSIEIGMFAQIVGSFHHNHYSLGLIFTAIIRDVVMCNPELKCFNSGRRALMLKCHKCELNVHCFSGKLIFIWWFFNQCKNSENQLDNPFKAIVLISKSNYHKLNKKCVFHVKTDFVYLKSKGLKTHSRLSNSIRDLF